MYPYVKPKEIRTEKIVKHSLFAAGFIGFCAVASVFGFVGFEAWPTIVSQGFEFLWGHQWDVDANQFGAFPMIIGSLVVTLVALLVAFPLGLSAALFTSEILPRKFRPIPKFLMEILASIPSVVYGLIGIAVVIPWLQSSFGLLTGRTLLTGGLVLGVMVLPTLMTVSEDALEAVNRDYREAGWSLGLTRMNTIFHCVIPEAFPGICAAFLLGLGRALGETIAVMLLVGSIDRLPSPWFNWAMPGQTLTSKIGREVVESSVGSPQYHALAALALLLLISVLALTLFGDGLIEKKVRNR